MKNKALLFIENPYAFFLDCFGYRIVKPSLLFQHMIDFTHSSWVEDLTNQNRLQDYSYELYLKQ